MGPNTSRATLGLLSMILGTGLARCGGKAISSDRSHDSTNGGTGSGGSDFGGGTGGTQSGTGGNPSGTGGMTNPGGMTGLGGTSVAGSFAIGGTSAGSGGANPSEGGTAGSAGEPSDGGYGGAEPCEDLCREERPACCSEELRCVQATPRCRIDLLGGSVGVVYEYADLKALTDPLTEVLSSFPDTDIEWAAADSPSSSRIELRLNSEASSRMKVFESAYSKPFRLSCNDVELFVGVIYMLEGAAGLRTPVLHIEDDTSDGEGVVLWLGAWQGAWAFPSGGGDATLRERLDRTELRAALCARGILHELEAP